VTEGAREDTASPAECSNIMSDGAGSTPIGPYSAMNPLSVSEHPIVGQSHWCAAGFLLCSGHAGSDADASS
jgi:hypothetical protein